MFGLRLMRQDDYERVLVEAEVWKTAFEQERERADRLNDLILQSVGRAPVSTEAVMERKTLTAQVEKLREAAAGIFEEDGGAGGEMLFEDLVIGPKETNNEAE